MEVMDRDSRIHNYILNTNLFLCIYSRNLDTNACVFVLWELAQHIAKEYGMWLELVPEPLDGNNNLLTGVGGQVGGVSLRQLWNQYFQKKNIRVHPIRETQPVKVDNIHNLNSEAKQPQPKQAWTDQSGDILLKLDNAFSNKTSTSPDQTSTSPDSSTVTVEPLPYNRALLSSLASHKPKNKLPPLHQHFLTNLQSILLSSKPLLGQVNESNNSIQSAKGLQPPTSGLQPPTLGPQPPTSGPQPPTSGLQPPTLGPQQSTSTLGPQPPTSTSGPQQRPSSPISTSGDASELATQENTDEAIITHEANVLPNIPTYLFQDAFQKLVQLNLLDVYKDTRSFQMVLNTYESAATASFLNTNLYTRYLTTIKTEEMINVMYQLSESIENVYEILIGGNYNSLFSELGTVNEYLDAILVIVKHIDKHIITILSVIQDKVNELKNAVSSLYSVESSVSEIVGLVGEESHYLLKPEDYSKYGMKPPGTEIEDDMVDDMEDDMVDDMEEMEEKIYDDIDYHIYVCDQKVIEIIRHLKNIFEKQTFDKVDNGMIFTNSIITDIQFYNLIKVLLTRNIEQDIKNVEIVSKGSFILVFHFKPLDQESPLPQPPPKTIRYKNKFSQVYLEKYCFKHRANLINITIDLYIKEQDHNVILYNDEESCNSHIAKCIREVFFRKTHITITSEQSTSQPHSNSIHKFWNNPKHVYIPSNKAEAIEFARNTIGKIIKWHRKDISRTSFGRTRDGGDPSAVGHKQKHKKSYQKKTKVTLKSI